MKKNHYKLMAACGIGAVVMSCASMKNSSETPSLQGQWDVVSIIGMDTPLQTETKPFIAFGTDGQVSGNAGCNRMMGTYEADTVRQTLSLGQMGSTRMMCRDQKTENALLAALGKVKAYRAEKEKLVLVDEEGTSLVTLMRSKTDK